LELACQSSVLGATKTASTSSGRFSAATAMVAKYPHFAWQPEADQRHAQTRAKMAPKAIPSLLAGSSGPMMLIIMTGRKSVTATGNGRIRCHIHGDSSSIGHILPFGSVIVLMDRIRRM
jgi:hypothetical protein